MLIEDGRLPTFYVRPVEYGGVGGGIKFVWRGILFKLADGSKGPYCGNDEAAAKGAFRVIVADSSQHLAAQ